MKVLHIITDLEQGGAEGALARLVLHLRHAVSQSVISLRGFGAWGRALVAEGVPVHCMHLNRYGVNPLAWARTFWTVRNERAQVVQTWMYHADLIGGVAAKLSGEGAISWGIRNLDLPRNSSRLSTRLVRRLCASLSSRVPDVIVSCSQAAADLHRQLGYARDRMIVIPNGVDMRAFRPDNIARIRVRSRLGFDPGLSVVGMVARWDPVKGHRTLLEALRLVMQDGMEFACILVGAGIDDANKELRSLIASNDLSGKVKLLGATNDVMEIYNALDWHILASQSEAFPNVIVESMACGTPCVVSDVGDARMIVGNTGIVVRPGDGKALATAITGALAGASRNELGAASRRRIEQNFDLSEVANRYVSLWTELASCGARLRRGAA